jgi:AcrR family transcriptional regulator
MGSKHQGGFDATPTKTIADQAGVATGLVFYHFDSKEGLLEALLKERSLAPELERLIREAHGRDPREVLLDVGRRFRAMLHERRNLVRILLQTASAEASTLARFQHVLHAELAALSSYLADAFRREGLSRKQAALLARSWLANILFGVILLPDEGDPAVTLPETLDMLLRGIGD